MALKRFIVEFGMGADLHGQDVTKAAQRAVRDAISHCCLCGLSEVAGMKGPNDIKVKMKIACPMPERLDQEAVRKSLPYGDVELVCEKGGMLTQGMHREDLGEGDNIVIALASLTVYIDVK